MTHAEKSAASLDLVALRETLAERPPRGFWRSLDELAETPEFLQQLQREFPSQLAVWNDVVGRRNFLRLMAASFGLAGAVGCTRLPPEEIVPYVHQPLPITQGVPLYFATAMTRGGYALGLLAKSFEGRPIKVEGNPNHPASLGATDAFAQASVLSLYDPDRSQTLKYRGLIETWDRFLTSISEDMNAIRNRRGRGLRILTETVTSPTLAAQLNRLLEDLPEARWHQYEAAGLDNVREGARRAFGRPVDTVYRLDRADVILSLDADILLSFPGSVRYGRDFIDRRRLWRDGQSMNRLFVAESTPTITGAMADHRLPVRPSQIEAIARELARRLGISTGDVKKSQLEGIDSKWLEAVVADLQKHRGSSVVVAGQGQPPIVHALTHAINNELKNVGRTVEYIDPVAARASHENDSLGDLVDAMKAGDVDMLMMLGGNPVYNAPGYLEFAEHLQKRVRLRVHLSPYYDETSFLSDWHIPEAHYLEAWSDARAYDGTATILQPLIAPLYGGRTAHELVSMLNGKPGKTPYELVQAHWQEKFGENAGEQWQRAVHDGVVPETKFDTVNVNLTFSDQNEEENAASGSADSTTDQLEIEFRPDPSVWDGRYANNGWLQELPKPLTKITWDNAAYVGAATAERLQLKSGDVVAITVGKQTVHAPVWIVPGQSEDCVSLTFGYGRTQSGRVGSTLGYNAYAILPNRVAWFGPGSVRKTGDRYSIVTTQTHHSMEGRDIVRVTTFDRYQHNPRHLEAAQHHGEVLPSLYPDYDYSEGNAWGMVIDQTACIGCNACVVACQAENNSPVVGKDQVAVGRAMQWLRIDRYYYSNAKEAEETLENPETYFQPMMCVHCEKAPCEVVCPVAATVHDSEGINDMVYNRCVGTRYCSNNCPYKVRRFNWLQYQDTETPVLKLLRNPDVTVRSRGVMEKCTYCIQRISHARIEAKRENRAIRDGEVITACQQSCPTQAISFGNLNDSKAQVNRLKQSPLNYGVLAELDTQPRTTFLARVVNPHPDLPPPQAAEPYPVKPETEKAHP
jgi:molybdopterin-containing oxidoreductase family iron-sulfur binding subunit